VERGWTWVAYYNGLFKIIEPNDLKVYNKSMLYNGMMMNPYCRFMCTAFGDVFAYVKNKRFGN